MQTKKQAFELIQGICNINEKVWGNHYGSYVAEKEAAYQIEEAIEGFDDIAYLAEKLGVGIQNENSHKIVARAIIDAVTNDIGTSEIPEVDCFDKALDAIYFAIGSMHKLGLAPHQIVEGLQVVHTANLQKTGKKDAEGKVGKPDNFVPPEDLLQEILNARG